MKISCLKAVTLDSTGALVKITGQAKNSLEFGEIVGGGYRQLVPIKLPNAGGGDERAFVTCVPVDIKDETTTNAKGKTRVMLKVTLPYTAINPNVDSTATVTNQFDSRRTGGEMTAHVVLSVPKACIEDIRGNNGSLCQRGASAQVATVVRLLGALLGNNLAGPVVYDPTAKVDEGAPREAPSLDDKLAQDGEAYLDGHSPYRFYSSGTESAKTLEFEPVPGYETAIGINAEDATDLASLLKNPIMRGLSGLPPIDAQREIQVPTVVVAGMDELPTEEK